VSWACGTGEWAAGNIPDKRAGPSMSERREAR
jgi:hypothetical protein